MPEFTAMDALDAVEQIRYVVGQWDQSEMGDVDALIEIYRIVNPLED